MRQKIAGLLNTIFLIISGVIIILWIGYFLFVRSFPELGRYYLAGVVLCGIALPIIFLWLEQNWDKRIITKMTREGNIALANIISLKKLNYLRDSGFNKYWLYEIEALVYDKKHSGVKRTLYEKIRYDIDDLPCGSVYVTYDETKPEQVFVIPNALISCLPELAPIVSGYEKDEAIEIKYLDVFYNKGMVFRTFDEVIKERLGSDSEREEES